MIPLLAVQEEEYCSFSRDAPTGFFGDEKNDLELECSYDMTDDTQFFVCSQVSSLYRKTTAVGSHSSTWNNMFFSRRKVVVAFSMKMQLPASTLGNKEQNGRFDLPVPVPVYTLTSLRKTNTAVAVSSSNVDEEFPQ